MKTKFDYSKLLGRIKEFGFTQAQLAEAIGISKGTLSAKLNNLFSFTTVEILAICRVLNIPADQIGAYFYAEQVQKTER